MSRHKPATILAEFDDHHGPYAMLFGTSYRTWWDQLEEFCRCYKTKPKEVTISRKEWIWFGGLKWCQDTEFQSQLDIEGKGRKAEEFVFGPLNRFELNCLRRVGLNELSEISGELSSGCHVHCAVETKSSTRRSSCG